MAIESNDPEEKIFSAENVIRTLDGWKIPLIEHNQFPYLLMGCNAIGKVQVYSVLNEEQIKNEMELFYQSLRRGKRIRLIK